MMMHTEVELRRLFTGSSYNLVLMLARISGLFIYFSPKSLLLSAGDRDYINFGAVFVVYAH
jgi:hypothetical protein